MLDFCFQFCFRLYAYQIFFYFSIGYKEKCGDAADAELLRDHHEGKAADIGAGIAALTAQRSFRADQPLAFVIADGGYGHAGAFGNSTKGQHGAGTAHQKILERKGTGGMTPRGQ